MKKAHRLFILLLLIIVQIVLLYALPPQLQHFKYYIGAFTIALLFAFIFGLIRWRQNLTPEEIEEIEKIGKSLGKPDKE
ncbi:MAG: hypothetical protein ACLFQV_10910 [Vulcanimicrobiota bacterium]